MMYDIVIGHVERMEMLVSGFVRRWLVRPKSHLLYGEDTAAVRPLN